MRDISFTRIAAPSVVVTVAMNLAALVVAQRAGLDGSRLPLAYILPTLGFAVILVLAWMFSIVLVLARRGAPTPLAIVRRRFRPIARLMVLPLVVTPIFLAAFSTAKSGIWPLVGFHWDRTFAAWDAWIFGTDPWRLTHGLLGPFATRMLEVVYTLGWGLTFAATNILVVMSASRRTVAVYFLAMLSCWFVAGFVLAYLLGSAGPVFAYLSDPALGSRFAPLSERLPVLLGPNSPITLTQAYLVQGLDSTRVVRGGGISAMPSMHIGTAAIMVMAARRTGWLWPALAFLCAIWLGSVHFGYHYAVDGLVVIPVALLCWKGAELVVDRPGRSAASDMRSACPANQQS